MMPSPCLFRRSATRQHSASKRKRQASKAPSHGAAKRARVQAIEGIRQDVRDEEQLARWVGAYRERMAALRAQVQLKQREAADWLRRSGFE